MLFAFYSVDIFSDDTTARMGKIVYALAQLKAVALSMQSVFVFLKTTNLQ